MKNLNFAICVINSLLRNEIWLNIYLVFFYLNFYRANTNSVDSFKWTALHFACHTGQKDIVELLIDNGASLDAQSNNGGTPIMRAIESSKCEVVQFLIDKG